MVDREVLGLEIPASTLHDGRRRGANFEAALCAAVLGGLTPLLVRLMHSANSRPT